MINQDELTAASQPQKKGERVREERREVKKSMHAHKPSSPADSRDGNTPCSENP
jgi:hypothetical protein